MPCCVPIRDLKDTARFSRLVETANEPVCVTRNGYDHLMVMTAAAYRLLQDQVTEANLLLKIAQAEAEIANGRLVDGADHIARIREKYDY